MKRKIGLILKSLIILLVLTLCAYYFGFLGARPIKLHVYTQEENDQVYKCLKGIQSAKSYQEEKGYRDNLYELSFQEGQNILHYAFNHGNPDLFRLLADQSATLKLFKPKDSRGNRAMVYYYRYCKFSNLKPLKEEILEEDPMSAINHIVGYFDGQETFQIGDEQKYKEALTLAIEQGKLDKVKEIVFSTYGNNDKSQWGKSLNALANLPTHVAHKDEIESLLSTLKADRKEDDNFWKRARKLLSSAPNVESMTNYLHKLVATSPEKKRLLYYIIQIGGLRGYQIYKHIQHNHAQATKTSFSDLVLAANDPHHPIKLNLADQDEYQQRLAQEIAQLKGYMYIDAHQFAQVNPEDRRSVQQAKFGYERTFVHACVLKETPEQLELCCKKYLDRYQKERYERYWRQKDTFGLTPADYLPLVEHPLKKQHLRFLQDSILAPTEAEIDFLRTYKARAEELELGNLNFDSWLQTITGYVITRQKDKQRNTCHIAALLGDLEIIKFLSINYADFKTLCEEKDSYNKTPEDYAKLWLDENKRKDMCLYLTTQFDIQGELTKDAVAKAIKQSNWQQIGKWQREEPIAFGAIWAQDGSELLTIATSKEKPITYLATYNHFKLLEQLSKCEAPTQKMVQNTKALLQEVVLPTSLKGDPNPEKGNQEANKSAISPEAEFIRGQIEKKAAAEDNVKLTDNNEKELKLITKQLKNQEKARFIPDHTNHNKTILHTLLPKLVASATADEFKELLKIDQENFKIALCLVDNNQKTPLDLIKKALKDKKHNAKEVDKKLNIIKKYEADQLATYQSKYRWHTKTTATSLYKKDNILGLEAYLSCPASYMSPSLLETMIKDGAYDVVEKVCNIENLYVVSAAKALTATQKDDGKSPLTTLLAHKTIEKSIKCRQLLKQGAFIQEVTRDEISMPALKQLERMWKTYPVYCATMANKYWNDENSANPTTSDQQSDVQNKFYEKYRFLSSNAQKKLYGFNNAHIAVISNDLPLLEKYAKDNRIQLECWLNQTDHMGRTPLYYINYGKNKTSVHTKALFNFINTHVDLDAAQILKSRSAADMLFYIKECPFQYESNNKVKKFIFLSPRQMLVELSKKEKADRNPLHYACLGMDNDISWLLQLLKAGDYTKKKIAAEIMQVDTNGCRPIDYVSKDRKKEFEAVFAIYDPIAILAHRGATISDMQQLAQEVVEIFHQNYQHLAKIQKLAQAIAKILQHNNVAVDSNTSKQVMGKLNELTQVLEQIDTDNLGEKVKEVITNAYQECKGIKDSDQPNVQALGTLLSLADQLKDIDLFTCKDATLRSLKAKITDFTSVAKDKNWTLSDEMQDAINVIGTLSNSSEGTAITTEKYNSIKKALKYLGTITISDIDGRMDQQLSNLVSYVKAYNPYNNQELSYPLYGKAKKFWRKDWIGKLFKEDSWSSLFALDTVAQENYLPELYSQLLKPAHAQIAKALISKHKTLEISLNERDSEGKTWLLKAIEKQQWDIAKCLVEAGADLSIKDIYDTNALFLTIVIQSSKKSFETGQYHKQSLEKDLLDYINKKLKISKKGIVARRLSKSSEWVNKRVKQIFYYDVASSKAA